MASVATLGIRIDSAQALAGLRRFDSKLKGVGLSAGQVGAKLKKFGKVAGLAIGGLGIISIKTAADFEQSMNKVAAIGGSTGKTLLALENQARDLGKSTVFSASEAAEGMTFLAMAGFDAQQTLAAMPGILNLAAASGTDLATSADIASNILSGLGMKASKTGKLVDVMAKATASANMNVTELGEAMKMSSPMAKTAGLSMQGMTAILGKMADAGIKGSLAGTGLRAGIVKLLKPTTEAKQALRNLGVGITETDGTMRNFIDILADLEKGGASATDMIDIFGQRSGPALMASMSGGVGAIKELKTTLDASGGAADKMAKIQLQGLNGAIKKLKSAWEELQIKFAKTGILTALTDKVDQLTDSLGKPETIARIKSFGEGVLSIGTALKGVWAVWTSMPTWMQGTGLVIGILGGGIAKTGVAIVGGFTWAVTTLADRIRALRDQAKSGEGALDGIADKMNIIGSMPFVMPPMPDALPAVTIGEDVSMWDKMMEGLDVFATSFDTKFGEMKKTGLTAWEEIGQGMADIFGEGGSFATSIGAATAQFLVFGEKGELTMKKLGKTILSSVVGSLISQGVQMAINAAKEVLFGKAKVGAKISETATILASIAAITTANVAAGVATTAAWIPAATAVSLATYGANAAPAMAGMSATAVLGRAISYDGGGYTGDGSRSGGLDGKGGFMAMMHPQETVTDHTKRQTSASSAGVTNEVNIEFTVNAMDTTSFQQQMVENQDLIVGVIRNAFNEQGESVPI